MLIGKNKFKMYKKALCLIFAFLLSIDTLAAVVSDNDGSAFITKAEFEAMKENFSEQINKYNNSIDSKIDGAIATYLAGLAQKTVIEKNLANSHSTRTFVNTFGLDNTNRLGDYVEGFCSVVLSGCNNDSTWTTANVNSTRMTLIEFNTNGGIPSLQTRGTNKDCFLLIRDSSWKSSYKVALLQVRSTPYAAWGGCHFHHGQPPLNSNGPIPSAFSIAFDGTSWGSEDKPITINFAGVAYECDAQAYAINRDEQLDEADLSFLAGSNISASVLYSLHVDDYETKGPRSTNIDIDGGYLRNRYGGTQNIGMGSTWPQGRGFYLYTYHHKYQYTYSLNDFVVDSLSAVIGEPVRYYSGLPLFKASNNGTVEFTLKLMNSGNETSKVAIKNGAFENVAFSEGMDIDNDSEWTINGTTNFPSDFSSNVNYKIKMDVKKDKLYFIKVLPNTNDYNTKVEIIGDIVNTPA